MAAYGQNAASITSLQPEISKILQSNIDKYNPSNIHIMEDYVEAQAREGHYDLEANLLLLKLYQLNPGGSYSAARASYVAKVLLMGLMQLPRNDFQICKALTEPELTRVLRIQDVMRLETSLETCQFDFFWNDLDRCRDTVAGVEGFDTAIRNYICSVIGMTNQTIKERQLIGYLGPGLPYEKFKRLVEEKGWRIQGDKTDRSIFIKDQTMTIKPRKITEAIDFADVATILSAAAQ
ncbi:eukaryotic translation initiation factor 3 subunit K-like [Paramacrobiotus metropolitanus]|uniref:eukaryotic translation initiation factor 3 subunit K-like n=1 Tax=Paramacrobiotus metropolitanus TaxID=2943436 RepID=UPI002446458A|nr:eukaryotic translation initiation factor 3 subunit K-like [Paramacrobiotus metropolitanus]XP_055345623.1 eukaryotic translation initiation factor 3 subunit K-like [Paramacrobiotus metropolitanus]